METLLPIIFFILLIVVLIGTAILAVLVFVVLPRFAISGTVRNLKHTYAGDHDPVTIFDIYDGDWFYHVACYGHNHDLSNDDQITAWASSKILLQRHEPSVSFSPNGTFSLDKDTSYYRELKKYHLTHHPRQEFQSEND